MANIKKREVVFEKNFTKVAKALDKKCRSFLIKGVPDAYKGIWVPNNEIRAWSIPERSGQILKMFALARKPKTILELGTSFGYSALWLGSAARSTGGMVYTIELTKPKIAVAREYFRKARLAPWIRQIEGRISDVLASWRRPVDFLFMDADRQQYHHYFKAIEPFLVPGAVIVVDNASDHPESMKRFLAYVKKSPRYHSHLIDVDHGLFVAVKGD